MVEVRQTERFVRWLAGLRDLRARARVLARVERLIGGNPGDVKPVGAGVSELRINYGPGYRVYYLQRGTKLIILLAGGDKSSQAKDVSVQGTDIAFDQATDATRSVQTAPGRWKSPPRSQRNPFLVEV